MVFCCAQHNTHRKIFSPAKGLLSLTWSQYRILWVPRISSGSYCFFSTKTPPLSTYPCVRPVSNARPHRSLMLFVRPVFFVQEYERTPISRDDRLPRARLVEPVHRASLLPVRGIAFACAPFSCFSSRRREATRRRRRQVLLARTISSSTTCHPMSRRSSCG